MSELNEKEKETGGEPAEEQAPAPKPKRRVWRIVKRVVLGLVLLLVVGLVVGRMMLPGIIQSKGQEIATGMLGVEVRIGDVDLSILGGSASLQDFTIHMPEGFNDEFLIEFADAGADVDLWSLMSDTIVVERLHLDGARVRSEVTADGRQAMRTFVEGMMKRLEEQAAEQPAEEEPAAGEEAPPAVGIRIDRIDVTDTQIFARDAYATDSTVETALRVADVRIDNIVVPAPGQTVKDGVMTLTVSDVSMDAPERFEADQFLAVTEFTMDFDLARMMATADKPEIVIPEITATGTRLYAEQMADEKESAAGQNINEAVLAFMNAYNMTDPLTMEEFKAPPVEEEKVVAATTPAQDEGKKPGGLTGFLNKARETASSTVSKVDDAVDQARETISGEGDEPPPPPPPPEEAPFKVFILSSLKVDDLETVSIVHDGDERTVMGTDIDMTMNNLVYPLNDTDVCSVVLAVSPVTDWSEKGHADIQATFVGASLDTQVVDVMVKTESFPMGGMGPVSNGYVTSESVMKLDKRLFSADITARIGEFETSRKIGFDVMGIKFDIGELIRNMSSAGAPLKATINPPIRIKDNMTVADVTAIVFTQLLANLAGNIGNMAGGVTDALSDQADKLRESSERLRESTGLATDVLEGGTGKVEEGARKLTEGLEGLFGDKKDDGDKK